MKSLPTGRLFIFYFLLPNHLRIHPLDRPWEGDRLTDMLDAAQPGRDALHTHAEAGMWNGAILAEFQIPLEGFLGQILIVNAL